jgi:hypothetical protein
MGAGRRTTSKGVGRPPDPELMPELLQRISSGEACPYGTPGDLLWVTEGFSYESLDVERNGVMPPWYWADGNPTSGDFTKLRPSIHMPRWASRLTLEIAESATGMVLLRVS